MSVHIVPQWERACVLRLGKFSRIVGPGLYFTVPFVEYATMHVDQRIMVVFVPSAGRGADGRSCAR